MELSKIGALLAKAEVTYATDPTPTGAANNIVIIRGTIPTEPTGVVQDRDILDASHQKVPGLLTLPRQSIKFRTELRGNYTTGLLNTDISSGKVTNLIEIDCLLQACDLIPTYTAQVSETPPGSRDGFVIYKPTLPTAGAIGPSVTFYAYSQRKLYKATGCKGNIEAITWAAGNMCYIDWAFSGKYVAVADSSVPSLTFLQTVPPLFKAITSTHTVSPTPPFTQATLKLGNQIIERLDAQDASTSGGIHSWIVGGRQSTFEFDPESLTEAAAAWWAAWVARSNHTLTQTHGTQTGNKFTLTTKMNVDAVKYSDRNGNRIQTITSSIMNPAPGDPYGNDLTLKFF